MRPVLLSVTAGDGSNLKPAKNARAYKITWGSDCPFDDRNKGKKRERENYFDGAPLLCIFEGNAIKQFNFWTPSGAHPRDSINEK